jgi:TPR repeat protein
MTQSSILVHLYRLAADQGDAPAKGNLGRMYGDGEGVPKYYVEAHTWFNLATSRATDEQREDAVEDRDQAAGLMNPTQLAEAQRLAREWDAAHPREP